MAILSASEFNDDEIKLKIENNESYIDDDLVTAYWHELARNFSVDTDNLPDSSSISKIVKRYLVNEVCISVCIDNYGANIIEMSNGITVDQWELKQKAFEGNKSRLLSLISASNVYDPNNPPEDNSTSSSSIIRFNEYPSDVISRYLGE